MEIEKLIRATRKARGWTLQGLADELARAGIEIDPGNLSRIETGKQSPNTKVLNALLDALDLSVKGQQLIDGKAGDKENQDKYAMIPLLKVAGACGNGCMNDHEEVEGELAFRRDWLKKMGIKAADLRVIYATGDSMYPSILDGDVLLVNVADQEPVSGKIYVLRKPDSSIIIKRLNQRLTGGWVVSSDNPDKRNYPDEDCDETTLHALPIIGRVVWRGGSGF